MQGGEPEVHEVVELQSDLSRRYRNHGPKLRQYWRSLNPAQRQKVMIAGAPGGFVLAHSQDHLLGNVCKLVPEWNLADVSAAGSDLLIRMLEHRATMSLEQQYISGLDGRPGDHHFILEMMHIHSLQLDGPFQNSYSLFVKGNYGRSFCILNQEKAAIAALEAAFNAGFCIPQSIGELILIRQLHFLRCLTVIVEDILEAGSTTRSEKIWPKMSQDGVVAAFSKLSIKPTAPKVDLASLLDMALSQKTSLDDTLSLMFAKPVMLCHLLHGWFFSRPELVADEMGCRSSTLGDRFISGAFLDTVHNGVRGAATWDYICQTLELLKSSPEKSHREIILQEISNACHFEYRRAQAVLRRQMSIVFRYSWFKRVSNVYDNGNARIILNGKPEDLAGGDQQVCCLLRLCQPELTISKAADCLTELDQLHAKHPTERERLRKADTIAIGDLAIIVAFIQSLSPVVSMPTFSRKKGQLFVTGAAELEAELNQARPALDLFDFVVPIDNLLERGVAIAALKAFEKFIVEKTGTKLESLYYDLIEDCITKLHEQLAARAERDAKHKARTQTKSEYIPFPPEPPKSPEARVQERRQKEKTRPAQPSAYGITSTNSEPAGDAQALLPPPEPIKVKPATAQVFLMLFDRTESRGSVPWIDFEGALAELGFSVIPKFGSVFTFYPPEGMAIQKPLTLHRPHGSRIEGHLLAVFARRLGRLYGWGGETFQST
ncbi:putative ipa protein [Rosellinia necatrix]|uniref:Putative ipa protein n=1 Tax=Rosellinia necatrix TaxID=77044 RepID=A0A1W2TTB5_ROSNE|nr:putative ipa protein [Rosellinia necatrix]